MTSQYGNGGVFVKPSFAIFGNVALWSTCSTSKELANGTSRLVTSRSETSYVSGRNHYFHQMASRSRHTNASRAGGKVQVVTVWTPSGTYKRLIVKIVRLVCKDWGPVEQSCSIILFCVTNVIIVPIVVVAVFVSLIVSLQYAVFVSLTVSQHHVVYVSLTISLHYIIVFVFAVFFYTPLFVKPFGLAGGMFAHRLHSFAIAG